MQLSSGLLFSPTICRAPCVSVYEAAYSCPRQEKVASNDVVLFSMTFWYCKFSRKSRKTRTFNYVLEPSQAGHAPAPV